MRIGLMIMAGLLAGCAVRPPPVEVRTVRVEVPVQVPCKVRRVVAPAWAADGLRKSDSLEVKVRALLAERLQRQGYVDQLTTAVGACQ
ncbi:hypothetical protein D3C76_365300 [compost metagenome]